MNITVNTTLAECLHYKDSQDINDLYCKYTQLFALILLLAIVGSIFTIICICDNIFTYTINKIFRPRIQNREFVELT